MSQAEIEKWISDFDNGIPLVRIADCYSTTLRTVKKHLNKHGRALGENKRTREMHHNWNGGRSFNEGYIRLKLKRDDPFLSMVNKKGYVLEHRYNMARSLGRVLRATEQVHHIDGNRLNNHISNLQLRQGKHGSGSVLKCACCGSYDLIPAPI